MPDDFKFIAFLQGVKFLLNHELSNVVGLVSDPKMVQLAEKYCERMQQRAVNLGLNIFALVSDIYHRENFHSDVLKALLDPKNGGGGSYNCLYTFFDLLKMHGAKVHYSDYTSVTLEREKGRVDILITDDISKRAIIIENKINEAQDQRRQLPTYLKRVKDRGYKCDAIVYLRLNRHKEPDPWEWTNDDKQEIHRLLVVVLAYDESDGDLLNAWLRKCELITRDAETGFVFRQYGSLITALGKNIMNKEIMHGFYSKMLEATNFETAKSMRSMLDNLSEYRRGLILSRFRNFHEPFTQQPKEWHESVYFEGLNWQGAYLGLDVVVEFDGYTFQFWDRNNLNGTPAEDWAKMALQEMQLFTGYSFDEKLRRYVKEFTFPDQEQELYQYLELVFQKLRHLAPVL